MQHTADSVTLNLLGELLEHVNLPLASLALLESAHDLLRPLAALSAGCALAATLVAVEVAETADGSDNIGALVHDDNGSSTETRLAVLEGVKVHQLVVADVLGQDRSGRATRDVFNSCSSSQVAELEMYLHSHMYLVLCIFITITVYVLQCSQLGTALKYCLLTFLPY